MNDKGELKGLFIIKYLKYSLFDSVFSIAAIFNLMGHYEKSTYLDN